MSATVDERVVEMQFNNKQFEQNANQSIKTLDKLNASLDLKGSSEGFDMLNKSIKSIDLSNINGAMDAVTNKISVIGTIGDQVIRNLTNKAIDFGTRWVKSLSIDQINAGFQKYASKTESVQTIMNATGKSIDEVSSVIEKLNQYTDETSYNFTEMVSSVGKFTSAGIDLEVAEKAMEGIANWAAKAGVGTDKAGGAFYNLSQAIGSGALKMQDWKSIENLNMATLDVKNQFIEAGLAAGTLVKQYDKVVTANGRMEVTAVNFRDSLQKGWINSDVLISTMEKYADRTTEFGLAAFHAAQEAKTFKDAIEATKDAVSTGWMNIFEQIFGNYEEARVLWTNVANELIEAFTAPTEALNTLFGRWHKYGGYKAFVDSLTNSWTALKSIVTEVGDLFSEVFPGISAISMTKATESLRDLTKTWREFTTKKTIEDYFDEDRLEKMEKQGVDISEVYKEINEQNEQIDDNLAPLKDTFNGLFSVLKLIKTVMTGIGKLVFPFIKLIGPVGRLISTMSAGLGRLVTNMVDAILGSKELNTIFSYMQRAVNGVTRIIGILVDDFSDFVKTIGELPQIKAFIKLLDDMWQNFKQLASPYIQKAKTAIEAFLDRLEGVDKEQIYGFINTLAGYLTDFVGIIINIGNAISTFLQPRLEKFKVVAGKAFDFISGKVSQIFNWVSEFVQTKEFQTIKNEVVKILGGIIQKLKSLGTELVEYIRNGGLIGIFQWLKKNLTDIWDTIRHMKWSKVLQDALTGAEAAGFLVTALSIYRAAKLFKTASSFIENFPKALKNLTKGLGLKRVALSVLMLAGALYLLAQVPIENIWKLVAALTTLSIVIVALSIGMTAAMGFFAKLELIDNKAMLTASASMLVMAAAIFLLAKAAVALGKIPGENLKSAVASLLGIMIVMSVATIAIGNAGQGIKALGIGLLAIAAAVVLLVLAFDKIKTYIESLQIAIQKEAIVRAAIVLVAVTAALLGISFALKRVTGAAWQSAAVILATGAAVYLVAVAAKKLLEIDTVGLGSIFAVLAMLTSVMLGLAFISEIFPASAGNKLLGMGAAIAGLGVAVIMIVLAISMIAKMDPVATSKAIDTLWQIMEQIALVMLASSVTKVNGGTFLGLGIGIAVIVGVLKYLSNQNYGEFLSAAGLLGAVLTTLGISLRIGAKAFQNSRFGDFAGIALVVATIAGALWLLANYVDPGSGLAAALSIGITLLALGASLKRAVNAFQDINLTAAFSVLIMLAAISGALYFVGQLSPKSAGTAVLALCITMEVLADSLARMRTGLMGVKAGDIGLMLLAEIAMLAPVVAALKILETENWSGLLSAAVALGIVLPTLAASMAILSKFNVKFSLGQIGSTFLMMAGVLVAVGGALALLTLAFSQPGMDVGTLMPIATSISAVIVAMTGVVAAISLLGRIPGGEAAAVSGLKQFITITTVLLAFFSLIGAVNSLLSGSVVSALESAGDVMSAFGAALGNFIGGLVGGVLEGISDTLPSIAQNLNTFILTIVPGLNLLRSVKVDKSSMEALSALASAILKLTANDIISGITNWLTGGSSIADFAEDLVVLGPALAAYGSSLTGVSVNKIKRSAEAIGALVDVANNLHNVGGFLQSITGAPKDLATFADELGKMVEGEGGATGGLRKFAEYAPEIAQYEDDFKGVASALSAMVEVANAIKPNITDFAWGAFHSETDDLKTFAEKLPSVGGSMKQFYTNIKDLPDDFKEKAENVATAIDGLVDVANKLQPDTTGIFTSSTPTDLGTFLSSFAESSEGIQTFLTAFNPTVTAQLNEVAGILSQFADISIHFSDVKVDTAIRDFAENLSFAGQYLVNASGTLKYTDFDAISTALDRLSELTKDRVDLTAWAEDAIIEMVESMQTAFVGRVKAVAVNIANNVSSSIKSQWDSFVSAGSYIAIGLISGMLRKSGDVYAAGKMLGSQANLGLRASMDINSPSRVMIKNGEYIGEGFVIGIKRWLDKAGQAGANLAESTVDAASLALDYVHELMSGDMDVDMTIRPVMDLTDVNAGMNTINSLFSQRQALMAQLDTEAMDNSSDIDELLDVGWKILKEIQNGSDLYLDDKVLAGRINRRLGQA